MWFFTQLQFFFCHARLVRHWHGRRVGRWRVACDGSCSRALARHLERNSAERLSNRQSAGCARGAFYLACLGLAADVLDRRAARACWLFTSGRRCRSRKPGNNIVSASTGQILRIVAGGMEANALPCCAHDFHDVSIARHTGFVSRFLAGSTSRLVRQSVRILRSSTTSVPS